MSQDKRTCERPGCGIAFEPKADNQRYHDSRCAKKAERQRRKARERPLPVEAKQNLLEPVSPNSRFTPEEIEIALTELVLSGSKPGATSKLLAANHGIQVSGQTLSQWKNKLYPERYQAIANEIVPQRYQDFALRIESGLDDWLEAQELAVKRTIELIPEANVKDISNIVRNIATGMGINADKASVIRGRPTEIRETHSSPKEVIEAINQRWPGVLGKLIEGTAVEVTEEDDE